MKNYRKVIEINSQEEFEKFGQKVSKLVWRGTKEESDNFYLGKLRSRTQCSELIKKFNLQKNYQSDSLYVNNMLKISFDEYHTKLLFNLYKQVDEPEAFSEAINTNNIKELMDYLKSKSNEFLNGYEKLMNSGRCADYVFKEYSNLKEYINDIDNKQEEFINSVDMINENNKYDSVDIVKYDIFLGGIFDEGDYSKRSGVINADTDLLKINCDLDLPEDCIIDVLGDVKAQNINGGLIGCLSLKAQNIKCNYLICESLDCENVDCHRSEQNRCLFYSFSGSSLNNITNQLDLGHLPEMYARNKEFATKINGEIADEDGNYSGYFFGKANMIVGKIIREDKMYHEDLIDYYDLYHSSFTGKYVGEKDGHPVLLDSYTYFEGGKIMAVDIKANNILSGKIMAETIICNNILSVKNELDEMESIKYADADNTEEAFLPDEEYDEIIRAEAIVSNIYQSINADNIVVDNIACSNLKANTLFASNNVIIKNELDVKIISAKNIEGGNNVIGDYIKSDKISGRNVKANNIVIDELKADKLELGTIMSYSDSAKIDIREIDLSKEASSLNPELKHLDSKINIIAEANKSKPKQLVSSNDKVLELE